MHFYNVKLKVKDKEILVPILARDKQHCEYKIKFDCDYKILSIKRLNLLKNITEFEQIEVIQDDTYYYDLLREFAEYGFEKFKEEKIEEINKEGKQNGI
ncbi:MAG: hypothetical protein IJZ29_05320 [Clostridia bacterium]|nr:hypothetical protein [Clostridia bacterium]